MKTCTKCRETKPIAAFAVQRSAKDQRHAWCRACHGEYISRRRKDLIRRIDSLVSTSVVAEVIDDKGSFRPVNPALHVTEAAYLAGVVDGEGSIVLGVASEPVLYVMVANTDPTLIRWLHTIVGGGYFKRSNDRSTFGGTKPIYRWTMGGLGALCVIEQIFPYLTVKRPHAEFAMAFYSAKRAGNVDAALQAISNLRALNNYGRRKLRTTV